MEGNDADVVQPAAIEDVFYQLLSLVPMAKEAGVLEEIATSIDVDTTTFQGDMRRLVRAILNRLNSDEFDQDGDRERLIRENSTRLATHLGITLVQPK